MKIYQELLNQKSSIAVVGLGYVGLPLAEAFSRKVNVFGFDVNEEKILKYRLGIDVTQEVGNEAIANSKIKFTSDETCISDAKFIIVAVPTPVTQDKTPDLSPVIEASKVIGRNLSIGSIVVYESTVYPGVTEDICVPILEEKSGLKCGRDFKVGYSPERINPADKLHRVSNIKKIVSGMDQESLEEIANVYNLVVTVGVYCAENIKIAEAAKVVENAQRDINIAFMNELAMAFDKMGIDTNQVVNAMNTKWNALGFRPGLVGGHCIGVDPYYFIYKAEQLGFHSQLISAGRKINDDMGKFIAENIVKQMILAGKKILGARVAILGITFKENCQDVRNSKIIDIIDNLRAYGIEVVVSDEIANKDDCKKTYGVELQPLSSLLNLDCIVVAVAHDIYKTFSPKEMDFHFSKKEKIIVDIKSIYNKFEWQKAGYRYWNL